MYCNIDLQGYLYNTHTHIYIYIYTTTITIYIYLSRELEQMERLRFKCNVIPPLHAYLQRTGSSSGGGNSNSTSTSIYRPGIHGNNPEAAAYIHTVPPVAWWSAHSSGGLTLVCLLPPTTTTSLSPVVAVWGRIKKKSMRLFSASHSRALVLYV